MPIVIAAALALLTAALVSLTPAGAWTVPGLAGVDVQRWVQVSWLVGAAALVALLRGRRRRGDLAVLLVGAVLIGAAAMTGPPRFSDDSARYAWDGIVSTSGISPYAHPPVAAELAGLRPQWLFQAP